MLWWIIVRFIGLYLYFVENDRLYAYKDWRREYWSCQKICLCRKVNAENYFPSELLFSYHRLKLNLVITTLSLNISDIIFCRLHAYKQVFVVGIVNQLQWLQLGCEIFVLSYLGQYRLLSQRMTRFSHPSTRGLPNPQPRNLSHSLKNPLPRHPSYSCCQHHNSTGFRVKVICKVSWHLVRGQD